MYVLKLIEIKKNFVFAYYILNSIRNSINILLFLKLIIISKINFIYKLTQTNITEINCCLQFF